MAFSDLSELEILQGSFSLIYVIIAFLIGIRILTKYFSFKRKEFITVGFTMIFICSPWWGSSFSFLSYVFFGEGLPDLLYLALGCVTVPVVIMCWIYSFSELAYPKKTKKIVLTYLVICIPYEIILIIFLFVAPSIVGTMEGTFNSQFNLYPFSFSVFSLITSTVTGIIFSRQSMKADDPKIQWKGRFLLAAFISFPIGAVFDAGIPMTAGILIIIRLILISAAIEFYLGFLLPDRIANWLIKKRE